MQGLYSFDYLNNLGLKRRSIPFKEYFKVMNLPKDEIDTRLSMAHDIYEMMAIHIILCMSASNYKVSESFVANQLQADMLDVVGKYGDIDDYIQENVAKLSKDIAKATLNHLDDPYYLSEDRAMFVAEDEANTFANYIQYVKANASCSTSTWHTMKDNGVRHTHVPLDGKTLPMGQYFNVGGCQMRFPKDLLYAEDYPEEYIGCRCFATYK